MDSCLKEPVAIPLKLTVEKSRIDQARSRFSGRVDNSQGTHDSSCGYRNTFNVQSWSVDISNVISRNDGVPGGVHTFVTLLWLTNR